MVVASRPDQAKQGNAQSHAIDRIATSSALAQLIPRRGGLASSQLVSWLMKASAYRSSLVRR
jgi:hypothetical protein